MLVLEHILYLIVDIYVGATGNIRSVVGGLKKINRNISSLVTTLILAKKKKGFSYIFCPNPEYTKSIFTYA